MTQANKMMTSMMVVLVCGGIALGQAAPKHPMNAGLTTPAAYAQKLPQETLAKHPEIVVTMMHANHQTGPPTSSSRLISAALARFGMKTICAASTPIRATWR